MLIKLWPCTLKALGSSGSLTHKKNDFYDMCHINVNGKINMGSLLVLHLSLVSASDCSYGTRHHEVSLSWKAPWYACAHHSGAYDRLHRFRIGPRPSYFVPEHSICKASLSERSWCGETNLLKCSPTIHYSIKLWKPRSHSVLCCYLFLLLTTLDKKDRKCKHLFWWSTFI